MSLSGNARTHNIHSTHKAVSSVNTSDYIGYWLCGHPRRTELLPGVPSKHAAYRRIRLVLRLSSPLLLRQVSKIGLNMKASYPIQALEL